MPREISWNSEAGVLKIGLCKLKSYAGAGGISWNYEAGVLKIGLYKLKSYAGAGGNKLEF